MYYPIAAERAVFLFMVEDVERGPKFPAKLEIVNPSLELQYKALETLPSELKTGIWRGAFVFDDLSRRRDSLPEEHLLRTEAGNIAPFSTLTWEFSSTSQGFKPNNLEINIPGGIDYFAQTLEDIQKRDRANRLRTIANVAILSGKLPNQVKFDCSDDAGGFEDFRRIYLPQLRANKYNIGSVELWLSFFSSGSDYSKGLVPGTMLVVNGRRIELTGLDYDEYHGITAGQKEQAVAWFNELKATTTQQAR